MHSHRNSDGAIRSRRDWNKGKKSTASLIATTFLQCLTSSISTKAGPLRPPKPRDHIEFDSSPTRVCIVACLCILAFSACEYEVPITPSPTQKVQEPLLGDWTSTDGKEKMKVRKLDDSIYIVYYDGDLFRAYHSDIAETPFVSVHDLNSNDRKYAYVVWKLSDDGNRLRLRRVNKLIPKETKDSATVAALLTKNVRNPELFGEEIEYSKEK